MFERHKRTAQDVIGGDEIDRILALPMTQVRLDLKAAFSGKSFSAEDFEAIVSRLQQIDPLIARQVDVVRKAMPARAVEDAFDIELDTPVKTALWAAAFMRLMEDGKEPLAKSRLWAQMQESIGIFNEEIRVARVISSSLQNDAVTFGWGQPGSWFYHDPKKNHINLDMFMTLMMGFEHMRVVHLHEIGHSELSNLFPPRMRELYEKVGALVDPGSLRGSSDASARQKPKATEQEQRQMLADVNEWQLRFMLWHMVEDNCVNRFAVNMEKILPIQDFAASWNHVAVSLQGFGELARGDAGKLPEGVTSDMPRAHDDSSGAAGNREDEAQRRQQEEFLKLVDSPLGDADVASIKAGRINPQLARRMFHMNKTIVWLSFYERTGLLSDTDKGWARFKIFKEDVNRTVDLSASPEAKGMTAFDYLYHLSVGPDGISAQQPRPSDRLFGRDHYRRKVEETTAARNALMEKIWDIYLKPYADVLIAENLKNMENRQRQKQSGQNNQQGQQGASSSAGGGMSQGGGQPGGQGKEKGEQGGAGSADQQAEEKQELDDELENGIKDMASTPQQKKEQERAEEAAAQAQPENGAGQEEESSAQDQEGEKPGWQHDADAPQSPKKAQDMKGLAPIGEEMSAEQIKHLRDGLDAMKSQGQAGMGMGAGTSARDIDLSKLAKGDWRDFEKRAIELAPVINQVARSFQQIRERQKREIVKIAKNDYSFQAPDGDFQARFDRDKRLQRVFKMQAGQEMEANDFKSFHDDVIRSTSSSIEMTFMIDGSGSMPQMKLAGGVTAMEAALQSAVIMYLAARKVDIDAYIIMWGNASPLVVATPETGMKEVGAKIEGLRNGIHSSTDLSPALRTTIGTMAEYKPKGNPVSGSSHVFIYSDGDIGDARVAKQDMLQIARHGRNVSTDVAVLSPSMTRGPTAIETMFDDVIKETGSRAIGVLRGNDPNEMPRELARLVLRRVNALQIKGEPDSIKRRNLKSLHNKMMR